MGFILLQIVLFIASFLITLLVLKSINKKQRNHIPFSESIHYSFEVDGRICTTELHFHNFNGKRRVMGSVNHDPLDQEIRDLKVQDIDVLKKSPQMINLNQMRMKASKQLQDELAKVDLDNDLSNREAIRALNSKINFNEIGEQ